MSEQIVTYASLCTAVASTFRQAGVFKSFENFDELSEAIPSSFPHGRCYPNDGSTDYGSQGTDRSTFQVGVRATQTTLMLDCYAKARQNLKADIAAQVALLDDVDLVFCAQKVEPFFGHAGIKAFGWSWERVTFDHNATQYAGVEFTLTLIMF